MDEEAEMQLTSVTEFSRATQSQPGIGLMKFGFRGHALTTTPNCLPMGEGLTSTLSIGCMEVEADGR